MSRFFFWAYPWDLVDEGIEPALARLSGEIGVDAVSVAAVHPDVAAFRSRPLGDARTVRHEAGAHFQPDGKCYGKSGIRPVAAAWMKSRNSFERIAQAAQKQGLGLRAQVVGCRSTTLVSRYPMAACVDVFGDPSPDRLCPSNPDVREYLAALVEDLSTNYPVEAVELEAIDFGADSRPQEPISRGVVPSQAQQALLSWCFCASCRQRGLDTGIDVPAVIASVQERLERMVRLEPSEDGSFRSLLADDARLNAFHQMRVGAVASLAELARLRTKARLLIHIGSPSPASALDEASLSSVCDGVILPLDPEGRIAPAAGSAPGTAGIKHIEAAITCHPPLTLDGPSLVTAVHQASQAGYAAIGFSHYGLAPEPCLAWVRQAIRYARRESAS